MNCEGCNKDLGTGKSCWQLKLLYGGQCCHCNVELELPERLIYCSKKCLTTNLYWTVDFKSKTVFIEKEECNACGQRNFGEIELDISFAPISN